MSHNMPPGPNIDARIVRRLYREPTHELVHAAHSRLPPNACERSDLRYTSVVGDVYNLLPLSTAHSFEHVEL